MICQTQENSGCNTLSLCRTSDGKPEANVSAGCVVKVISRPMYFSMTLLNSIHIRTCAFLEGFFNEILKQTWVKLLFIVSLVFGFYGVGSQVWLIELRQIQQWPNEGLMRIYETLSFLKDCISPVTMIHGKSQCKVTHCNIVYIFSRCISHPFQRGQFSQHIACALICSAVVYITHGVHDYSPLIYMLTSVSINAVYFNNRCTFRGSHAAW